MVGYARVSTVDQNLDMQIEALVRHGVERDMIFTDKLSGASMSKRSGLKAGLQLAMAMRAEFVVWKLDRLGRTTIGVMETLQLFKEADVRLVSLTEGFDMGTPFGKAMVGFLAIFAEMERDLISERTKAGLARARERGAIVGRKNAMTEDRVEKTKEMLATGEPVSAILPVLKDMEGPSIGRSRLFDWVKDYRLTEEPSDPTDDR